MISQFIGGDRWSGDYIERDLESNNANRYRDRTFDDDYDGEKEDSDTESNHNNARKYKDNESIGSPKTTHKSVNLNLNTSINKSPVKTVKPLKKVDLGAAAKFGINSPAITPKEELLVDDFNPRALDNTETKTAEFGDFESAFAGSETQKSGEDFADFSSAFQQTNNQNLFSATPAIAAVSAPQNEVLDPLSQLNQVNMNVQANTNLTQNNATQPNLFNMQQPTNLVQNSNDLLCDFGLLNLQGNNANVGVPLNGNMIQQQQNLLDGFPGGKIILF